jgi:hypothetical protein
MLKYIEIPSPSTGEGQGGGDLRDYFKNHFFGSVGYREKKF